MKFETNLKFRIAFFTLATLLFYLLKENYHAYLMGGAGIVYGITDLYWLKKEVVVWEGGMKWKLKTKMEK